MRVRAIDQDSRDDVSAFVRLPFDIYRHCPQWVPPLISDMRRVLDRQTYPFYHHSAAAHLLVESEGQPLGRITVMDNRRYNTYRASATAFFYYFECVDDTQAAQALFSAAFDWARQRGLTDVLGPWGMLRADAHGLLVEGFEHRPAMGQPYNHAYYVDLFAQSGLEKRIDFLSGFLQHYELPQRVTYLAERIQERRGYRVKSFASKQEMLAWAPEIQRINNASFTDVFGFYPLEDDDLQGAIRTLGAICEPDLVKVVLKGDEVIGFLLCYPDVSEGLQRARGRLWPVGWWHILRARRTTRWMNVNGLALLPEYQGLGASTIMYAELQKSVFARGRDSGEIVQVAEDNSKSLGDMRALNVQWYKTHRVFACQL